MLKMSINTINIDKTTFLCDFECLTIKMNIHQTIVFEIFRFFIDKNENIPGMLLEHTKK